jgi:hypothetical protein
MEELVWGVGIRKDISPLRIETDVGFTLLIRDSLSVLGLDCSWEGTVVIMPPSNAFGQRVGNGDDVRTAVFNTVRSCDDRGRYSVSGGNDAPLVLFARMMQSACSRGLFPKAMESSPWIVGGGGVVILM